MLPKPSSIVLVKGSNPACRRKRCRCDWHNPRSHRRPRTRMIPISGEQICFLSSFHSSTTLHAGIDLHIAPPPLLSARHYHSRIDHQPECTSFSFALPHPRFTGPPTARACLPTAMTMCCGCSTPRNTCTLGSRRRHTAARRL